MINIKGGGGGGWEKKRWKRRVMKRRKKKKRDKRLELVEVNVEISIRFRDSFREYGGDLELGVKGREVVG